jgi:hypothetical protein
MGIVSLFTIVKIWETHTIEYYSDVNKEILKYVTTGGNSRTSF